jgi:hypothetical protein
MWKLWKSPKIHPTIFLRNTGQPLNINNYKENRYIHNWYYKEKMLNATQVEKTHLKVVIDGKIVGFLTSSSYNNKTGEKYHFISKEKHDGSILPDTNSDGSPNTEGQYFSILKTPLIIEDLNTVKQDKTKNFYLEKHEKKIKDLLTEFGPKHTKLALRVTKDSPLNYTEDGQYDPLF